MLVEVKVKERVKESKQERRKESLTAAAETNPAAKRALDKISKSPSPVPKPAAAAKPLTDDEWEKQFRDRARRANDLREEEEERSRKIGKLEDRKAAKDASSA
jgi:hypothetical protein